MAAPTFYFTNHKGHAGDTIYSRPFIKELTAAYPDVTVVMESYYKYAYLLADLGVQVVTFDDKGPVAHTPAPNEYLLDIHFMEKDEVFQVYGLSYNNFVHNFNASLKEWGLYERYKLRDKRQNPFFVFPPQPRVPRVKERAVLFENGPVYSAQSDMELNDYLREFAEAFPALNFYCSAKPNFTAHNVFDISMYNLIEISEMSNGCVAFLTRCSGVNAASMTEKNKYKPRCFAGPTHTMMSYWLWDLPENQAVQLREKEEIFDFLAMVNKYSAALPLSTADMARNPEKYRVRLGNYVKDVSFCKFLTSREEIEGCIEYLYAFKLCRHEREFENWAMAYVLSDLSDGNLLEIGGANRLLRINTLIKGIPGEKYEIDVKPAKESVIVNQIVGFFCNGVNLPAGFFQNITCLSISELGFDVHKFAKEASRLLNTGGKLYVTFHYWQTKSPHVFDKQDVLGLIDACQLNDLRLTEEMRWELGGPVEDTGYTIGILRFVKGYCRNMNVPAPTFYFTMPRSHAGDIILSRTFLKALMAAYPDVTVVVECHAKYSYLLTDLGVKMVVISGGNVAERTITPNVYYFDLDFIGRDEVLYAFGLSYGNFVHNYNAFLKEYGLYERYKLCDKRQMPFIAFPAQSHVPRVKERAVLVENGPVYSRQSEMELNDYLREFAEAFPGLNFYCAAKPNFTASNVFDISAYNLAEISEISNGCVAFLTRCSGVNAASLTEKNRYKPRCYAGLAQAVMFCWLWEWPENPAVQAKDKKAVADFLAVVNKYSAAFQTRAEDMTRNPEKYRVKLEKYVHDVSFCKILTSQEEIAGCAKYLCAFKLYRNERAHEDWETAYVLSDLSDGNLLEIGRSNALLRKNTLLKGIPGEKYEMDVKAFAEESVIVNQIVGFFCNGVNLPAGFFQNIICLSISEQGFDIPEFAKEASRLLNTGGKLYITFHYWQTKSPHVFDKRDVLGLIDACQLNALHLTEEMRWELGGPVEDTGYTVGMLRFVKRGGDI